MKVSTQRLPESQVLIEIEVDGKQMERSMDRAYRKLVKRIDVPGFRKGKTPRAMLERHIGRERLLQEAIDLLVPEAYNQALEENEIDAIDQPQIEMTGSEPLSFKATVPVRPTIELGDYKALRVPPEPVDVDEKDVEQSVDELRRRYAVHEPVDRAVAVGDIIRASVRMVVDKREVYKDDDVELHLREGQTIMLEGLVEAIVGAKKGEPLEVGLEMPEDGGGQLAGKTVNVSVMVKEIKDEKLPELDDEFAQSVGEGFATLLELRDRLRNDIKERLEAQAKEAYREKVIGTLVDAAGTIEFPPVMVDREVERLIREQARNSGVEVKRYLELVKKTPEQIREEVGSAASERVRRSLALAELADAEGIEVGEEEIDAEIKNIIQQATGGNEEQAERYRRLFDSKEARASLGNSLLTRRTLDRLVDIASDGAGSKSGSAEKPKAKAGTKKTTRIKSASTKKSTKAKKTETEEEDS
ncbi:MAG: trigger factor [Chloroflexi bacterium]|nr:trigger factor [Chloroflexota bacterium]